MPCTLLRHIEFFIDFNVLYRQHSFAAQQGLGIQSRECYIEVMRIVLMMLIFAIGFSGYAAAAHSVAGESCDPMVMEVSSGHASKTDMPDCPGHADDAVQTDSADQADSSKSGKSICLDCHHCCTAHTAAVASYSLRLPADDTSVAMPLSSAHKVGRLFSLLRHPKSSV